MTVEEKIALIEEELELDAGTLTPETDLSGIEEWDSMAYLSFVAMVDEHFGKLITAAQLKACGTVNDLLGLMQ